MIAGYGAFPLDGVEILAENEMLFPPSETVTLIEPAEYVAVTLDGFGGSVPSSYVWNSWLISSALHGHCALVVILVPLVEVNGSGSFALDLNEYPDAIPHPVS